MKKQLFGTLAVAMLFLASCGGGANGVTNPDDIGKQVLEVLKGIDGGSAADFGKNFMSLDQTMSMMSGGSEDFDMDAMMKERAEKEGKTVDEIKAEAQKMFDDAKKQTFDGLVKMGEESEINWGNLTIDSFEQEVSERQGMEGSEGTLVVKDGDKSMTFSTAAVKIGGQFVLADLRAK